MSIHSCDPRQNKILNALSESELEHLVPYLELIPMLHSEILFEAHDQLKSVYFPITAVASLLNCLEDGSSVEVAMVGNEGMLGVSVVMGNDKTLTQAIIKTEGHGYRVSIKALQTVLARCGGRRAGTLSKLLLRYTQALFVQMSQTIACNRRHALEQQLSTWLLSCFDRGDSNSLSITHELIAYILGVRRESITVVAKKLQQEGMIEYSRGHIELANRGKLEDNACECYRVVKEESTRWIIDAKTSLAA